ncbi:MAG: Flp family type IVb pilin [Ignavibacteria bacterium]
MNHLVQGINRFIADDNGVTMIEYGLLAALIAVVSILAITSLGTNLHAVFTSVCNQLKNTLTSGGTACN